MYSPFDHQMMERALELARRGRYTTHPNPCVGCVITQGQDIVGEGWHRKAGEAHAEVHALQDAGDAARGGTVYVTLEPHCYHSRTPPCTDALIRAGVKQVFVGVLDPNPQVSGRGVEQLRAAAIEVRTGLMESAARELNPGFERRMSSGRPRVIVKIAASLDGRVALANGASHWITGPAARADVQHLRAAAGAVLTGIETVLADDPQLNVREPAIEMLGRQPLRAVLDTRLRMPTGARMLQLAGDTLVFSAATAQAHARALQDAGAQVIGVPLDDVGRVDLQNVLEALGQRQVNEVLVEAGPTLAGRFLQLGLADELVVYLAPILLGSAARAMAALTQLDRLEDALRFRLTNLDRLGPDIKLTFLPAGRSP